MTEEQKLISGAILVVLGVINVIAPRFFVNLSIPFRSSSRGLLFYWLSPKSYSVVIRITNAIAVAVGAWLVMTNGEIAGLEELWKKYTR